MNRQILTLSLAIGVFLVFGGVSHGQAVKAGDTGHIDLLRSDIQQEKVGIIKRSMEFSEEEATAFWPVYEQYAAEFKSLGDERVALLMELAAESRSMSDEKAAELTARWLQAQAERVELMKKYYGMFSEAISPATAMRIMQLEYRMGLLVDQQIVKEMPVIE